MLSYLSIKPASLNVLARATHLFMIPIVFLGVSKLFLMLHVLQDSGTD